ncbi:3-beta hydroxysteroid dehydrogenase/isomerase [Penicillium malachiteum]|uniref:3-beta hydroxysteroid dehydrogenase/isomerase n=1 Tax=Penicillium malachiteum TaxID=1324776 RepID=A0AAD6HBQ8_9EURO|nr:3-beta hydroxysteroid dehydrogenase/isomerase [Penicillium malachiteum]
MSKGLVGSWIVAHLLTRGENPASLRILDLISPSTEILVQGVDYIKPNITDELDFTAAFDKPWPEFVRQRSLTVFHTAAIIRPSKRLKCFLPFCANVNINGTKNILSAAKKAGATCFVSTSSGSVSLHKLSFWITPWERLPRRVMQILSDDPEIPERHDEYFGNYAVTKIDAERIVRSADDPATWFRTGCIRPANGILGLEVMLIMQSFVNAENVSIAHLLYEQRLIEQGQPSSFLPNIGGQSFVNVFQNTRLVPSSTARRTAAVIPRY